MIGKTIDMVGRKYGKLTVIEYVESRIDAKGRYVRFYKCKCDCGNESVIRGSALRSGNTKSCGCYRKEVTFKRNITHGMSSKRIYKIYRSMLNRCFNKNEKSYFDYGKRGITICDQWLGEHGFENFCKWAIENGYSEKLTIDRIDVDGNYEPSNCRWTTNKVQQNNKRNNKRYTWNGETHSLREWGEIKPNGLKYTTLVGRIYNGWDIKEAFETTAEEARKRQGGNLNEQNKKSPSAV